MGMVDLGELGPSLNRFFVSDYFRTLLCPAGSAFLMKSQSLLRQRLLPDIYHISPSITPAIKSQSLLRQRLLPDENNPMKKTITNHGSQSLLRQRLLPDASGRRVRPHPPARLNRFFVSDYFRTSSTATMSGLCSSGLNRFFVSDYFRTPNKPYLCTRMVTSQSLLRQRLLPDKQHCARVPADALSQSLLRQRLLPDLMLGFPSTTPPNVSIASSSAITSGLSKG